VSWRQEMVSRYLNFGLNLYLYLYLRLSPRLSLLLHSSGNLCLSLNPNPKQELNYINDEAWLDIVKVLMIIININVCRTCAFAEHHCGGI
jgi:hypothetical protein